MTITRSTQMSAQNRTSMPVGCLMASGQSNPAADTVAGIAAFEDYTGSNFTALANPGQRVTVIATVFTESRNTTVTAEGAQIKVGVSLDGGASYTFSPIMRNSTVADQNRRSPESTAVVVTGTPTGTIQIKLQIQQTAGVAADMTWDDTLVTWQIFAA